MLRWTSLISGILAPLAGRAIVYASRRSLATWRGSSHYETGDRDRCHCRAHPGPAKQRESGLSNMRDRLESLGGELDIRSSVGRGTTVTGIVPSSGQPP